ncbi:hypothetical protein [Pseudomonas saponiphila]|uniref:hypothetical protein n=1 Tax=Pseudomonas saponiphila TaxID=556534 RepID=UPI00115F8BB9|nr:hypothetical protein [Pseudomonas saponiphila]
MGSQASVDVSLSRLCSPKDIVMALLDSGWSFDFEGDVLFLLSSDIDSYDWQKEYAEHFNLKEFLDSHSPFGRIGIAMVFDGRFGGEFLISRDCISLSISINRICVFGTVPDFTEYVFRLKEVVSDFGFSDIRCEYVS